MALQSFYLQSQIVTGLYTNGGQWQLQDGTEYVGPYHQYINDRLTYTNATYQKGVSKQLFPLVTDANIKSYNAVTKNPLQPWALPKYYYPKIQPEFITQGWIPRYFVQVRNMPLTTIVEIDSDQFNNIGTPVNGIDDVRYGSLSIRWKITGAPLEIATANRQMLVINNQQFSGIYNYLTNLVEFSGYAPITQQI